MTSPADPIDPSQDPFRTPGHDQAFPPPASTPPPSPSIQPASGYQTGGAPWSTPPSGHPTVASPWTAPPVRQSTSPWIIALVVVSSLALIVGAGATIVGSVAVAVSTGSLADPYDQGSYAEAGEFGSAATYGEYTGTSEFAGLTSIDGLGVGTCFSADDFDDDFVGKPEIASCDDPHDYEVFATSSVGGGAYPGADDVTDDVNATRDDKFPGYIGADYEDSLVEYGGVAPTVQSWENGERGLVCVAFLYQLHRTGSLRDSGE